MDPIRIAAHRRQAQLSQSALKQLIFYDPESGLFTWVAQVRGRPVGAKCGSINSGGYRHIVIDGVTYRANRLAFLYMEGALPSPSMVVDHVDGDRANDRWANLRIVTQSENVHSGFDRRLEKTKRSRGVTWDKSRGKWLAQLWDGERKRNLGRFLDKDAAEKAWREAYSLLNGN